MRVLFVHNGLGAGGAERSLAELLPRLALRGIDATVVCLYRRKEGVESAVLGDGFDVRYLSSARTLPRVRQLREILDTEQPDLIHTTLFESSLIGRLAASRRRPIVLSSLVNTPYTPVRLREDPMVRPFKLKLVQTVDGWTARHLTDHFHAITEAVKTWAVETIKIDPEQITVIERGRDPARLGRPSAARRAAARAALGLRDDHEVILNVGRQEYQKGQRYLLGSMHELATRRPNAVLLVAGREGNATRDLSELTSTLGLGPKVRFLGHREDVPELLAAADLFVFPSLYEGQGGSVIEAMALGLPLVLSDIPALREVSGTERNAVLVEPASSTALTVAIEHLLSDRDRRRTMGTRSGQIFDERFTLDHSAGRMIELYERLVSRVPRRTEGVAIA